MAATHRAVYQILEHGHIFSDPLTVGMLGVDGDEVESQGLETPSSRRMRLFISIRTQFAQAALADAWQRGIRQLLVLGAGLDTFSYRQGEADTLRVFEVDRRQFDRLPPVTARDVGDVAYVAVDLEDSNCAELLAAAGFDRNQRTLVTWLGVVPYLTDDAFWTTLKLLAALPGGAELVFDYSNPPHTLSPERHRLEHKLVNDAANEDHGLGHFDTAELHERLREAGFVDLRDLGPVEIAQRYLPDVNAAVAGTGGHIVHIATR
jgi:methyltransferase (TIGR00027 family)